MHIRSAIASLLFASTALVLPAAAEELAIGAQAPAFALQGTDGAKHALADYVTAGKDRKPAAAVVVVFTCNHCPYAIAYEPVLQQMAADYAKRNVQFLLINPNDPTVSPGDTFDKMVERAKEKKFTFPYLYDADQSIAKAYGARVTPHIFLLDSKLQLRYRGRINDNHKEPEKVQSPDLAAAIDAVLAGTEVATPATTAFGCTIKWKKAS